MSDELVIYIDRLTEGKIEQIDCLISPEFMEIEEPDLRFMDPVKIKGSFYTTPDHLIGHLQVSTYLQMPCAICDETFAVPIAIEDYYITEPLENIPSGLYYPQEGIREAILIETPSFYECNDGHCPDRMAYAPFMKQKGKEENYKVEKEKSYLPFKDLE